MRAGVHAPHAGKLTRPLSRYNTRGRPQTLLRKPRRSGRGHTGHNEASTITAFGGNKAEHFFRTPRVHGNHLRISCGLRANAPVSWSVSARRHRCCEAVVQLSRATAPSLEELCRRRPCKPLAERQAQISRRQRSSRRQLLCRWLATERHRHTRQCA